MSAQVTVEPTGKEVGRVTLAATIASVIPALVAALVVVVAFLVGMISDVVAASLLVGILGTAGLTSPAVFTTGKLTPTDRVRTETKVVPVVEGSEADRRVAADSEPAPRGSHVALDPVADPVEPADSDLEPVDTDTLIGSPRD